MNDIEHKPKNYSSIIKVAVFAVALVVTGTIIFQGNFLEGVLKLIGAGASETQEVAISSVEEFAGTEGDWWVYKKAELENVEITSYISGQQEDPMFSGFITPRIMSSDTAEDVDDENKSEEPEEELIYKYTSRIINLQAEGSTLRSITAVDYRPIGSEIVYAYRTGTTSKLSGEFITLEDTSAAVSEINSSFIEHQSLQELPIPQFMQLEITFLNVNIDDLSAVAEVRIAYQPEEDVAPAVEPSQWGDMTKGNPQIAGEIKIDYNELTIPSGKKALVRINAAADGRKVAEFKDKDLSKHTHITFEDVELLTGEEYVVVIEIPDMDNKILYFAASYEPEANYEFTFGAFYSSSREYNDSPSNPSADLNGDGAVNAIDYKLFLEAFQGSEAEGIDF